MERKSNSKKKTKHRLKNSIRKDYQYMEFLIDEKKQDSSKVDTIQTEKYNYSTLIEDIVIHYQNIRNLESVIQKREQQNLIEVAKQSFNQQTDSSELQVDFDIGFILRKYPSSIPAEFINKKDLDKSDNQQEKGQKKDSMPAYLANLLPPKRNSSSATKTPNNRDEEFASLRKKRNSFSIRKDSLQTFKALVSKQKAKEANARAQGKTPINPLLPRQGMNSVPRTSSIACKKLPPGNGTSHAVVPPLKLTQIQQTNKGRNKQIDDVYQGKKENLTLQVESQSLAQAISSHQVFAKPIQPAPAPPPPQYHTDRGVMGKSNIVNFATDDLQSIVASSECPTIINESPQLLSESRNAQIESLKNVVYVDWFLVDNNGGDASHLPEPQDELKLKQNLNVDMDKILDKLDVREASNKKNDKKSSDQKFKAVDKNHSQSLVMQPFIIQTASKKKMFFNNQIKSSEDYLTSGLSPQKQPGLVNQKPTGNQKIQGMLPQSKDQQYQSPAVKIRPKMKASGKYGICKEKKVALQAPKRLISNVILTDQNQQLQIQIMKQRNQLQSNVMSKRNKSKQDPKQDLNYGSHMTLPKLV